MLNANAMTFSLKKEKISAFYIYGSKLGMSHAEEKSDMSTSFVLRSATAKKINMKLLTIHEHIPRRSWQRTCNPI